MSTNNLATTIEVLNRCLAERALTPDDHVKLLTQAVEAHLKAQTVTSPTTPPPGETTSHEDSGESEQQQGEHDPSIREDSGTDFTLTNIIHQEFKAGTWGEKVADKRIIMKAWVEKGKYIMSTYSRSAPDNVCVKRKKEMLRVKIGDIFHMKVKSNHYRGVVTSGPTSISLQVLLTSYPDVVEAAWHGLPDEEDNYFKSFDVNWEEQPPLTVDMKKRLNKLTSDGGGCRYQSGTLIPLS